MTNGQAQPRLRALAYLSTETPMLDRWREVGPEVFAMAATDGPDDSLLLRYDDRHHRIAVRHGEKDRLIALGWDVADSATLDALIERLRAAGIDVDTDDRAAATARHFTRVASFNDPFGQRHELAVGPLDSHGYTPPRPMRGEFVTGDGGMGHVVLIVPDLEAASTFYTNVLGFMLSDVITAPIGELRFFHLNSRHHSIAFVAIPGVRGLHHLMMEVTDVDEVGLTYDRLAQYDVPISLTMGRHPNDRMLSFYCRTPGGFEIEFGSGALQITDDATWSIKHYDQMSEWGHKPQSAGPPTTMEMIGA